MCYSCQNFLKDRTKPRVFHLFLWYCMKEFSGCIQHCTLKSSSFHEINRNCKAQKNWDILRLSELFWKQEQELWNQKKNVKKNIAVESKTKWTFICNVWNQTLPFTEGVRFGNLTVLMNECSLISLDTCALLITLNFVHNKIKENFSGRSNYMA